MRSSITSRRSRLFSSSKQIKPKSSAATRSLFAGWITSVRYVPDARSKINCRGHSGEFRRTDQESAVEHFSCLCRFSNAGKEEIFCGSADLMPRNLNRRVEVIYPLTDERIASYLEDAVLKTYLADTSKARIMQPDGRYTRVRPSNQEPGLNCQQWFLSHTSQHRR